MKEEPIYLVLTVIGVFVFGASAFFIVKLPTHTLKAADALIIQNVLASICASFLFLLTLDTGHYVRTVLHRRSFSAFFGDLSISSTANLVYPDFVLSETCRKLLKDVPFTQLYSKTAAQYPGTRFIDVPKIVASNDLLGIVIVAAKLGRYLHDSPRLITDGEAVSDPTKSLISFGLTSNAVTDLYLNSDPDPLFRLEDVGGDPTILVQVDGKKEYYGRTEEHQHGIILRYRPNPEDYPHKFWIICAGLAAAGTPAAAWSLAHKWRRYYRRFKAHDFLIVFKTTNDINSYVSSTEVRVITR